VRRLLNSILIWIYNYSMTQVYSSNANHIFFIELIFILTYFFTSHRNKYPIKLILLIWLTPLSLSLFVFSKLLWHLFYPKLLSSLQFDLYLSKKLRLDCEYSIVFFYKSFEYFNIQELSLSICVIRYVYTHNLHINQPNIHLHYFRFTFVTKVCN
jgi:hypothetical protein